MSVESAAAQLSLMPPPTALKVSNCMPVSVAKYVHAAMTKNARELLQQCSDNDSGGQGGGKEGGWGAGASPRKYRRKNSLDIESNTGDSQLQLAMEVRTH
jgi:hypothetical protein